MVQRKTNTYIVYWIVFFLLLISSSASYDGDVVAAFAFNLPRIPILIALSYVFSKYLVYNQSVSLWKKSTLILFLTFAGALLSRLLFQLFVFPYFYPDYTFYFFNWEKVVGQLIVFIAGIGGASLIEFQFVKQEWERRNKELSQEKKNLELSYLRAQMHPHFLFNTLNSIYSELLKKSGKATDMVLNFSELLRFFIYEVDSDFIQLEEEIKLIQRYIDIETKRYGNRLKVNSKFEIDGLEAIKVPPLIFFTLVENSFKHGASQQLDASQINIEFSKKGEIIEMHISNSVVDSSDLQEEQGGLGLKNIKRQLDLIYGVNYVLDYYKKEKVFQTLIRLPI